MKNARERWKNPMHNVKFQHIRQWKKKCATKYRKKENFIVNLVVWRQVKNILITFESCITIIKHLTNNEQYLSFKLSIMHTPARCIAYILSTIFCSEQNRKIVSIKNCKWRCWWYTSIYWMIHTIDLSEFFFLVLVV